MENCWYAQSMNVWLVCISRIQSLSSSSECIYTILPREMKCILCLCSKMSKFGSHYYLSWWTIGMLTQHLPRLQMANLRYVLWYQRWYCCYLRSCWWQNDLYQYWWHCIEFYCQSQSFCCIEHCQKWWHYIVRCQMLSIALSIAVWFKVSIHDWDTFDLNLRIAKVVHIICTWVQRWLGIKL